jgi:hypothetical protein
VKCYSLLLSLLFVSCLSSFAQDLPTKPEAHINVHLVNLVTHVKFTQSLPVPHRTADKAWWLWNGASWALTIADAENTKYVLNQGNARELNPLYGPNPSRLRLYAISAPIAGLASYISWREKRKDDAATAFGVKVSWTDKWFLVPLANGLSHGIGVGFTFGSTGR